MSKHMQNRPLSPHLTIYRPQLNSVLSILHRITGIALSITLLILIGFFISLIFGEKIFIVFSTYFNCVSKAHPKELPKARFVKNLV